MPRGPIDYLVIGAGSAGCVIAARLSEDPAVRVTLVEAGRARDWRTAVPGLAGALWRTPVDWGFATSPQAAMDGRQLHMPRGKVVGGTSAINYMVYIRGHRDNFDGWRDGGNPGWAYEDVLPLFKRSERNEHGASDYHGADGPLDVQSLRQPTEVTGLLAEATAELCRVPRAHDFNGASQDGAGRFQMTIRDGRRCDTALAFLAPARLRPNLTVISDAHALRIAIENGRAIGVHVRRHGQDQLLRAEREVIVSAGAIGSPQLLMLSGIGPAAHLREHGIAVMHDAPAVGQHLQDHVWGGATFATTQAASVTMSTPRALGWLAMYAAGRRGPMSGNFCEAGAFVRVRASAVRPDLQFHFLPTGIGAEPNTDRVNYTPRGTAFTILPTLLYPKSRGEVRLRSADPTASPHIDPRYFSDPDDVALVLEGSQLALAIAHSPAMKGVTGAPLTPASDHHADDATRRAELRARGGHIFHPVGTCRMGPTDDDVVDARLQVRGVAGLRVADASIMPTIVGGNTNAACIMIGEKAADLVRGR